MRRYVVCLTVVALPGCASVDPLAERERASFTTVSPVAAQYRPEISGAAEIGTAGAALLGGGYMALGGFATVCGWLLFSPPSFAACMATFGGVGAAVGAAAESSRARSDAELEAARRELGASDIQQLLAARFSGHAARLTSYAVDSSAAGLGPRSPDDRPDYSAKHRIPGTVIVELAVRSVAAKSSGRRPVQMEVAGTMRLMRPSDGSTIMQRNYFTVQTGGFVQEYTADPVRFARLVASAIDVLASEMVDDALLRLPDRESGVAHPPMIREPVSRGGCLFASEDCLLFRRIAMLETRTPTFRWDALPVPAHIAGGPELGPVRQVVYDLWIRGEENRIVEGLRSTHYTLEEPLEPCKRYDWKVRARFQTDAGYRAGAWSSWPFEMDTKRGVPAFLTPCPG